MVVIWITMRYIIHFIIIIIIYSVILFYYFMVYNNCGDFILELVALCVLCILENNQSIEHSIFYFVVIIRRRSKKRKRFLWRVDNPNRNTI